jgi:uncharacterized protein YndB with AHSA1/START domain
METGSQIEVMEAAEGIELSIEREYAAPRELVYRAWTEPEHFARWFGPRGSTLTHLTMDVRAGGELHFCHRFEDHEDLWIKGVYDVVEPEERIGITFYFSDEAGGRRARPGFPVETNVVVIFEEGDGRTRMTIRQTGLRRDQGEVEGWREGLDRLGEYLSAM